MNAWSLFSKSGWNHNCFLMAIKASLIKVKRRGHSENRLAASVKAGSLDSAR